MEKPLAWDDYLSCFSLVSRAPFHFIEDAVMDMWVRRTLGMVLSKTLIYQKKLDFSSRFGY
jgi:hypothetical protein